MARRTKIPRMQVYTGDGATTLVSHKKPGLPEPKILEFLEYFARATRPNCCF